MELRPHLMLEATRARDALRSRRPRATSTCARSTRHSRARLQQALDEFRAAGLLDGLLARARRSAPARTSRRGDGDARVDGGPPRRCRGCKPPFPSQVGYLGRPTLIQNVETLAHIPAILRNGGEWWAALGTRGATGTRLWSVTGAVGKPGCYEAPNGVDDARARRGVRGRLHGRGRRDRSGRRRERHPAAGARSTRR